MAARKLRYRTPLIVSLINLLVGVLGTFGGWFLLWFKSHQGEADLKQQVAGFAAGWLPFVLSVIVAFIPSQEKNRRAHMIWRAGLMCAGLLTSAVLWYNQSLSLESSKRDQQEMVQKANQHTDEAVDKANMHTDGEVGMVRDDLNTVREGVEALSNQFGQGAADLKESIGKVGKPDPPTPAKMQFSLWSETSPIPVLRFALQPDKSGVYTVDFLVTNLSDATTAHLVDTWLDLCEDCSFAKEPTGFSRPTGMRDQTRYMRIDVLNPKASTEKQSVQIKLGKPSYSAFEITWRCSCEVCGKGMQFTTATIDIRAATP
jgi:hypothetical protein